MICATADRWGAGRGDGPCNAARRDRAGRRDADGWWLVVGRDPYDCAYAVHMPDTMPPSNQRLKVLLITA